MKKITVCLVVLFVVSSTANASWKLTLGPGNVTASSSRDAEGKGTVNLVNDSGMEDALARISQMKSCKRSEIC